MSELNDLYQEVILDHNKRPRNCGDLPGANHQAVGHNPLCGDKIVVFLKLEEGRVAEVRFRGAGCAISTASASIMTELIKGKTVEEVEKLFGAFHSLVTGTPESSPDSADIGKLAVFQGVCEYPVRVKCATLAWHTMLAALRDKSGEVSTE
jgi:nitrogen fixation NifU-like protein